jgi:hypothetical protein
VKRTSLDILTTWRLFKSEVVGTSWSHLHPIVFCIAKKINRPSSSALNHYRCCYYLNTFKKTLDLA